MSTASLWRESASIGLNRASEEGNLTASDECPVTYVSLSHTHKWTSTSARRRKGKPICDRGRPGHLGGGRGFLLFHLARLGAEYEREVYEWPIG